MQITVSRFQKNFRAKSSVPSPSYGHDRHQAPMERGNLQSETPPRPLKKRKRRNQMHRDSQPNHRVKGDRRRERNPLQHEFPAGARSLQVEQNISQDPCMLPCLPAPPFRQNLRPSVQKNQSLSTVTLMYATTAAFVRVNLFFLVTNDHTLLTSQTVKKFK